MTYGEIYAAIRMLEVFAPADPLVTKVQSGLGKVALHFYGGLNQIDEQMAMDVERIEKMARPTPQPESKPAQSEEEAARDWLGNRGVWNTAKALAAYANHRTAELQKDRDGWRDSQAKTQEAMERVIVELSDLRKRCEKQEAVIVAQRDWSITMGLHPLDRDRIKAAARLHHAEQALSAASEKGGGS